MNYSFFVFENEIIISNNIDDSVIKILKNEKNFKKIRDIVVNFCTKNIPLPNDFELLINPDIEIKQQLNSKNIFDVDFKNNTLIHNNKLIKNIKADRVFEFIKNKKENKEPYKYVENFLKNIVMNPSSEITIDDIWTWIHKSDLPITDDGYILAFKGVDNNYKDCHTHTIDNSVGKIVSMPREKVCASRNEFCSTGLHFCSINYLSSFSYDHLMVIKINPKDIVSIPTDYNFSKGRCCEYEVLCEIDRDIIKNNNYKNIIQQLLTNSKSKNKVTKITSVKDKNNINIVTNNKKIKTVSKNKFDTSKKNKENKKDKEDKIYQKKSKSIPKEKVGEINNIIKNYYTSETPEFIADLISFKFNVRKYYALQFVISRIKNKKLLEKQ